MRRSTISHFLIAAIASGALVSCGNSRWLTPLEDAFDFDILNDVVYEVDNALGDVLHLEGHNIADGDYRVDDDMLIIDKSYLVGLAPGIYSFTAFSESGNEKISMSVIDRNNAYRLPNSGFETGDFFAWDASTIFKGEKTLAAFVDESIVLNAGIKGSAALYAGDGEYLYGLPDVYTQSIWEERIGKLTSDTFLLGGSGYITFKMGAGKNADLSYMRIIDVDSGIELARYGNALFDGAGSEYLPAALKSYRADLSNYLGQTLQIELVDGGGHGWDFLCFDSLETYYAEIPEEGTSAEDIKPSFSIAYVPNQVANGDFSSSLDYWSASTQSGWQKGDGTSLTWRVQTGVLRSDLGGDSSRGLIRSAPFRVDGSGIASLKLGAAQGSRYDKDTYVSIKEQSTNQEIIRFANSRHNGNAMIAYYIDLSEYLDSVMYLEIIDNATGSYDTIFVDDIITYYADRPLFDYGEMAVDLNY